MSEIPVVTIVVPTRDRWPYLRAALDSALGQDGVRVEVVVVDDCSRGETPARLAEIRDPRMRVHRHDTPLGVAVARNAGVAQANGEWVAFLDDDDLWSPEKLQRQLAAAEAVEGTFAYSAAVYVDERLNPIELVPAPEPDGLAASLISANTIPAGASNVLARTAVVRRLGGFDETLFQLADWDLWIRLGQAGRPAACQEPLVAYRMHAENMVLRRETDVMGEIERLAAKHTELARREGVEVDRVRYTRWIAWARRRDGRRLSAAATYLRGGVRYRNLGNLARAAGALLGERAMRVVGGANGAEVPATADLSWLEGYR
jgi:glycosyltransferase involved in cell wall biosynthesis